MKATRYVAIPAALTVLTLAPTACGGSSGYSPGGGGAGSTSQPSAQSPSASPTAVLTATQAKFVRDMRAQFGFSHNSDADVAGLGQTICSDRQGGMSQSATVSDVNNQVSGGGSNAALVQLAEKDLCPQYLPPPPKPSPPPPHMVSQTDSIVFSVQGTGLPSIQYGTDSINNNPGNLGPLGDGNALPWSATLPYNPSALYYVVDAQLEGSGSITDSVTEVIVTTCSGQSPKTESFRLANGSASGGYGIASAQYNANGDTGNALQAESDAGC